MHNLFRYQIEAAQSHILMTAYWMEALEHDIPGVVEEYYLNTKTYNVM